MLPPAHFGGTQICADFTDGANTLLNETIGCYTGPVYFPEHLENYEKGLGGFANSSRGSGLSANAKYEPIPPGRGAQPHDLDTYFLTALRPIARGEVRCSSATQPSADIRTNCNFASRSFWLIATW